MRRPLRATAVAGLALSLILAGGAAVANDPDGDHVGPGSSGPDQHSKNVKLLANVARSAPAVQSDLAFDGRLVYAGNYGGFRVIDVSDPEAPRVVTDFRCNGAQGDISVYQGLAFQSVDRAQSDGGCTSTDVTASTPGMFEGVRIFDVSDPASPRLITSVPTDCGSHTHTLVPDPANGRVVVYVSSYPLGGLALGPNCVRAEDGGGHSKISVIEVPLANPAAATVSAYHLDGDTQWATYLGAYTFRACHDISVNTAIDRAAAACMSEGQVWDISDPLAPRFLYRYDNDAVKPENVDLFHSASFSWDGTIVAFGDESGGGGSARCTNPDDDRGRIWFLEQATGRELASYKVPRAEPGTCTMHNFNFLPLRGRNVLVSAAYTAGTTIVDVDALVAGASEEDAEVGWYKPSGGNTWSSYWYNGFVYGNDILRGLDVFLLSDPVRAGARKLPYLNPQTQEQLIT